MKRMKLRSAEWWSGPEYYNFARRAWLRSEGFTRDAVEGKPVIGICNSWSELNNCNAHLRTVAEAVKRGVWAAGGVPLEFPTISLGEMFMRPTAMLFRNLMAMDVEECIRANPMDGVVLLCGCDKTTPAQLMGAASADLPAIVVPGGPMLSGIWKDQKLGSGTDGRKLFDLYRAGKINDEELCEIEGGLARSAGHCTVMGTASTMTSLAEALGMTLTGCAAIPAVDSRRMTFAEMSGRRIVDMVREDLKPSAVMTREAFENAITVNMAIGGSTNAVIHLIAIAGRLGVELELDLFDVISRRTPFLVNVKPSGEFLMEDFFIAGGVPAVMREVLPLLHRDAITVTGKSIASNVGEAPCHRRDVIRPAADPLHAEGGTVVLRGNLAPDGAVLKQTAASPELLQHKGQAYVFETHAQMLQEIDREDLKRSKRGAWVSRMGADSAAAQDVARRRERHGAHQRRADEWDQFRYRGAACGTGIRGRRSFGAGADGGLDRARYGWAAREFIGARRRAGAQTGCVRAAAPTLHARVRPPVSGARDSSESRLRFRFSRRTIRLAKGDTTQRRCDRKPPVTGRLP